MHNPCMNVILLLHCLSFWRHQLPDRRIKNAAIQDSFRHYDKILSRPSWRHIWNLISSNHDCMTYLAKKWNRKWQHILFRPKNETGEGGLSPFPLVSNKYTQCLLEKLRCYLSHSSLTKQIRCCWLYKKYKCEPHKLSSMWSK